MNKINKIHNTLDGDKEKIKKHRCNFIVCTSKRPEGSEEVSYDTEGKKGNSHYQ